MGRIAESILNKTLNFILKHYIDYRDIDQRHIERTENSARMSGLQLDGISPQQTLNTYTWPENFGLDTEGFGTIDDLVMQSKKLVEDSDDSCKQLLRNTSKVPSCVHMIPI